MKCSYQWVCASLCTPYGIFLSACVPPCIYSSIPVFPCVHNMRYIPLYLCFPMYGGSLYLIKGWPYDMKHMIPTTLTSPSARLLTRTLSPWSSLNMFPISEQEWSQKSTTLLVLWPIKSFLIAGTTPEYSWLSWLLVASAVRWEWKNRSCNSSVGKMESVEISKWLPHQVLPTFELGNRFDGKHPKTDSAEIYPLNVMKLFRQSCWWSKPLTLHIKFSH